MSTKHHGPLWTTNWHVLMARHPGVQLPASAPPTGPRQLTVKTVCHQGPQKITITNPKMTQNASLLASCVAAERHSFQYCLNHSLSMTHQRACQRPSQNCTMESPVFCTVCTASPVSVKQNCTCIPPDSVLHCLDQEPCRCMSTGTSTTVDELHQQKSTCNCGISTVFCTVNPKHLRWTQRACERPCPRLQNTSLHEHRDVHNHQRTATADIDEQLRNLQFPALTTPSTCR